MLTEEVGYVGHYLSISLELSFTRKKNRLGIRAYIWTQDLPNTIKEVH
jgi:hypothetical protein